VDVPAAQVEPSSASAWPAEDAATPEASMAGDATDPVSATAETAETPEAAEATGPTEVDPRVEALGLSPDFAAAEAEAMSLDDGAALTDVEAIPAIDEEALAARLAGLTTAPEATPEATTQLVVTGLVSVASIAGFKRHLGRVTGVRSVGVSSGPDGEFLFNVSHDPATELRDAIPTLPGFAARVTGSGEGILNVAAQDPESNG
jgi:hypothetical protein